jgi:hypothetical protein
MVSSCWLPSTSEAKVWATYRHFVESWRNLFGLRLGVKSAAGMRGSEDLPVQALAFLPFSVALRFWDDSCTGVMLAALAHLIGAETSKRAAAAMRWTGAEGQIEA